MNKENTQKLMNDFPALYRGAITKEGERFSCMSFGFSCGDGWFRLIYDLSVAIEQEAREAGLDPKSEDWPKALQVKEKLATLRFYCQTGTPDECVDKEWAIEKAGGVLSLRPIAANEQIQKLIREAEKKSASLCEDCGLVGKLYRDGWWRVLCDPCEVKRKSEVTYE
jgi:hypothetical protein